MTDICVNDCCARDISNCPINTKLERTRETYLNPFRNFY